MEVRYRPSRDNFKPEPHKSSLFPPLFENNGTKHTRSIVDHPFLQHSLYDIVAGVLFCIMNSAMTFQEKVYAVVRKIPKGKVLTYKEVARRVGKPRAYRAVGNILNKNTDPKVPCHRVIRTDGKTGGYRDGSTSKVRLLRREGAIR